MVNLSSFIRYYARHTPNRLAIIYEEERITYAEFAERIEAMAAFLTAENIKPGDVVAVFMKNSAAFLDISPSMIQLSQEIKALGDFKVKINLHSEVQAKINIQVIPAENVN